MPISNQYYFNQSIPLIEDASALELAILEELRRITNRTIDDPAYNGNARIEEFTEAEVEKWVSSSEKWVLATLPLAYLRGIEVQDATVNRLADPKPPTQPIGTQSFQRSVRVDTSARVPGSPGVLSKFPNHHQHLAPLEQGAIQTFQQTRPFILRDARNKYQAIAREALEPAFRTGTTATRRDLSQAILDRFARDGITAIEYPSGYRLSVESFAEREARSYVGKTAMQAQSNRAMERGYDLVRITQYAGPSPMCEPYQGKVFSLTGESDQYPALDDIIFAGSYEFGGGIYHDYCGHAQDTYIPGQSESIPLTTDPDEQRILNEMGEAKGNRFIANQQDRQRRIERQIRGYKKRQAVSLDKSEREKAGRLVKNWQARQREHIEANPFLRRQYAREQI